MDPVGGEGPCDSPAPCSQRPAGSLHSDFDASRKRRLLASATPLWHAEQKLASVFSRAARAVGSGCAVLPGHTLSVERRAL